MGSAWQMLCVRGTRNPMIGGLCLNSEVIGWERATVGSTIYCRYHTGSTSTSTYMIVDNSEMRSEFRRMDG